MGNTVHESVNEMSRQQKYSTKRFKNWKLITAGVTAAAALTLTAIGYYQANYFNANITINDIDVGGLTADQALDKLTAAVLKNEVYIEENQILNEEDTTMGFSDKDLPAVQKLFKQQQTFLPSFKSSNYSLLPSELDPYRSEALKKQLEEKLLSMNESLKAPQDAYAILEQGVVKIVKSVDGEQYDVASLLQAYDKQAYDSEIHLDPVYIQPMQEDDPIVKEGEKKLQALLQQTVDYKVQDQVHSLQASDVIQNASVSKDMKITIDPAHIQNKVSEINSAQSTLDKNFTFKTHSGSVISVKGKGYGWALNVEKEAAQIVEAFEKGETTVSASHISGYGWNGEGYGYDTLANNGIGDTYAEVSIQEQRIWLYRDGQMVFTTHVVTGRHDTNQDTSRGVWFVLYKRSPSTLKGTLLNNEDYAITVDYWAPFTDSGQGFHDASWRTNWANNAYLNAGSGGCVNVPPNAMRDVYNNLRTYQPVVIY